MIKIDRCPKCEYDMRPELTLYFWGKLPGNDFEFECPKCGAKLRIDVETKMNAVLLHEIEEKDEKLDRLDSLLESISLWMYKQQGSPLLQWADEFQAVCQMMEPK